MTETDVSTKEKYYEYVNFTVDCIIEEYEEYQQEDINELVFENVDSADIIIYTNYNIDVLKNSNYEPQEWKHLVSESDSWQSVIQAMAFDVFKQDVYIELHDRDNIEL